MKITRDFQRILTLALALLMLCSIVACSNNGNEEATTAAAGDAATDPKTETPTEKPTEAPTNAPTTAPQVPPADPPASYPTLSTDAPVEFDPWGDDQFSMYLPEDFAGTNVIKIEGANCETGCTDIHENNPNFRYDLSTVPAFGGASAMGCIKLLPNESPDGKAAQIYHYYIDRNAAGCKAQNGGESLTSEQCYIRWSFTVAEAGTYKVASYHRIKADSRNGLIYVDDQAPLLIGYAITQTGFDSFVDDYAGAYLTWEGVELELTAGTHYITYKLAPNVDNTSMHWRDFYLLKVK